MAGRIPDAFIQDLLTRTDIVEIIGARVELKRAGKEFKGLSPFTNEKSPSFYVSPAKQMFFCFSSGKNGTVISFLMEYDRLSFVEAVEELAQRAGLEVPREGGGFEQRLVLDGPLDALAAAERFYREQLKKHEPAKEYLKQRGVNGETAKTFGIGVAPESWDALTRLFPDSRHALDAGLLIEREGRDGRPGHSPDKSNCYDRFRNRIMFPIRDTRGRVIGFGGRTLANDPAKYLNSPETPLFHKGRNLYGLYEAKQAAKSALPYLIVVEGYMDVVMLAQHGVHEAVATLGTATTREHLSLLFKQTSKVVFCFDGDRAGRAAAWRALEQALPEIQGTRECRFLFLPDGHDPDTYVQEVGAAALREKIDHAETLTEFLIAELSKQADLNTLEGRAKLAALAKPHLAKLSEGPLRSLLTDELARITRLKRAEVEALAPALESEPFVQARPSKADPAARLPRRALRILLEEPRLALRAEHMGQIAQAPLPGATALAEAIEFFQEHPGFTAAQLEHAWSGTPKALALSRLAAEPLDLEGAPMEAQFFSVLKSLRERAVRAQFETLMQQGADRSLTAAEQQELLSLQGELAAIRAGSG